MIPPINDTISPTKPLDFTFYGKAEYYEALTKRIAATRISEHVTVATMSFRPDEPSLQPLLDELNTAAERGVKVHLIVDAHNFLIRKDIAPGPLVIKSTLSARMPKIYRQRLETLERLKSYGGKYTITNQPLSLFSNPFSGRSHIKFAVVNNYVFIGGCNLRSIDDIDLMAGWVDARTAGWLVDFALNVANNRGVSQSMRGEDLSLKLDINTSLLIDAGQPGQSIIFDTALELIDTARESILITCQFFPNAVTAQHLALAEARGVEVEIIFNHPNKHAWPLNLLHHAVVRSEKRKMPAQFFVNQLPESHDFLHAKLLCSDQATIVGSHNFVGTGVKFGTAEIALLSTDPAFGKKALASLQQQIESSEESGD